MKPFRHRIALPALTVIAMSTNSAAQAPQQEPEKDRWYNVELIVFSRTSAAAATSEVWEFLPELNYPNRYRFLQYADSETASEESMPVSGLTEITPATSSISADDSLDPNQLQAAEIDLLPTPFVRLAEEKWEFSQRAGRMQQSGRYDILFHESWNQPIVSSERAVPILLDQSGYLQEWPKLQGSIKLHLARFLHLETNFWINTMGSYLPGSWQMPAPPLGPAPPLATALDENSEEEFIADDTDMTEELEIEREPVPGLDLELDQSKPLFAFKDEEPVEVSPTSPWRHAVALQQKRKMRSTEVHYIDHPMMGVIVLVTPITEEELEAMAIEEFALDQNQPL